VSEVYQRANDRTTADAPQPVSFRRQVEAVKEAVRIEDVASGYGAFKLMGAGRLLGRCVSPDHEDKTPSTTIYTDAQRFKCYGCGEGGDVIDLVRLAEGGEVWEAMVALSTRYGVELPGRPPSWFRKQERQAPIRSAIEEARQHHVTRRVFRIFLPMIEETTDPDERREETELLWDAAYRIAELVRAGRIPSERRAS
jgi:DNA primase